MSTPSFHGLLAAAAVALGAFGTGVPSFAEPPSFGRLVFGAPIEEVRAALPDAGWSVEAAERHSARVTEIKAANFTTFADMSFAALIHEGRYGGYWITFTHEEAVANAAACETNGLALVAALEPRFGPFNSSARPGPPAPLSWGVTHSAGGVIGVTPVPGVRSAGEEIVRVGAQSTATVGGWRNIGEHVSRRRFSDPRTNGFGLRTAAMLRDSGGEIHVSIAADYLSGDCEVRVELGRGMKLPPPLVVAFDEARVVARPTISFAHYQVAELSALPAEGVEVTLTCHVVRETGHLRACEASAPASDAARPFVEAAKARARAYLLDLGDIDRDDPAGATTQLVVRLAPSDRRPTHFTGAAARPLRDLRWRRAPTSADLMEVYPRRALEREQEASLTLTCRIESDLSVVCGAARATEPAMLPVFEGAAHRVAARMLAAETLADGSPAAGTVFAMQVDFRIAK